MIHYISKNPIKSELFKNSQIDVLIKFLSQAKNFSFDIETTSIDLSTSKILLMQFGNHIDQYVLDCRTIDLLSYPVLEKLEDKNISKYGHYLKYDAAHVLHHYGFNLFNMIDSYIGEKLITNNTTYSCSLENTARRYLKIDTDKSERKSFFRFDGDITEKQVVYAARDIEISYKLIYRQIKKIDRMRLRKLLLLESNLSSYWAKCEVDGLKIKPGYYHWYFQEQMQQDLFIEKKPVDGKLHYEIKPLADIFGTAKPYYTNSRSELKINKKHLEKKLIKISLEGLDASILDLFHKERNKKNYINRGEESLLFHNQAANYGYQYSIDGYNRIIWHPSHKIINKDLSENEKVYKISSIFPVYSTVNNIIKKGLNLINHNFYGRTRFLEMKQDNILFEADQDLNQNDLLFCFEMSANFLNYKFSNQDVRWSNIME